MPHQWHSWLDLFKIYARSTLVCAAVATESVCMCVQVCWFVSPKNLCECRVINSVHPYFTRVNSKQKRAEKSYCTRKTYGSDFWKC